MCHLVRVCLREGRAGDSARDITTARGMSRQPVEPIDEAQHIRHEYVGDGEGPGQPFASGQGLLHMLEPGFQERVQLFPPAVFSVSPENWKRDHGRLAISTELSAANLSEK